MATVRIPTPLRKLTQGQEEVSATGRKVSPAATARARLMRPM